MVEIDNCHHCMTGIFLDAGKVAKCWAYLYGFINSFFPMDRVYLPSYMTILEPILHHYARTANTLSSNVIQLTRLTLGMRLLARTWRAASEWQIWAYVNNIARYTAINPGMGHWLYFCIFLHMHWYIKYFLNSQVMQKLSSTKKKRINCYMRHFYYR